jgi:hypothetical protein
MLRGALEMAWQVSDSTLITPQGVEFREGDTVRVTAMATSGHQGRLVDFVGMVATASKAEDAFKLWPDDKDHGWEQLDQQGKDCGKIWFPLAQVESLVVLEKGDLWRSQ